MQIDWLNPNYTHVLHQRMLRLNAIRTDETGELLDSMKLVYRTHPEKFIEDWCVTYDPRRKGKKIKTIPFILFPKQVEFIRWLYEKDDLQEDGICEKSRDAGATWLCMAYAVWSFLFEDEASTSFGSRKEALVDKIGDPKCMFEKGRAILRNIPAEFMPRGFRMDKHATFLKFINPENGSSITGEAGDQIGRGGRSTRYFVDEAAFLERQDTVDAALSENSDVKIFVSTPNGLGNAFHKKRFSGEYDVFTFNWRDDPRKDEKWYNTRKRKLLPHIFAQEIEVDYNASVEDICIEATWIAAAVGFTGAASGEKGVGFDPSDSGTDTNGLIVMDGCNVIDIQEWGKGGDMNVTQSTRKAWRIATHADCCFFNYDSIGIGAGVKGEVKSLKENNEGSDIDTHGVNVGNPASAGWIGERSFKELFVTSGGKKMELYWNLRMRF